MSDYKFSEAEKVAIWRADGEKCFYCNTPIRYSELQIDHVVPERIPAKNLAELRPKLPPDFEINSIQNWVTCHQGCNTRKNSFVFDTNFFITSRWLQNALKKYGRLWTNFRSDVKTIGS